MTLGEAEQVTYRGDSESDIYEPWVLIRQASGHLLIRACRDRLLSDQDVTLFSYLSSQPSAGQYRLDIPADPKINRIDRSAKMTVRFTPVSLKRPNRLKDDYPEQVEVQAVEVAPPNGQKPVHWRLLTTHRVRTYQQALQIIQWYRWRRHIEQLFAILKQRGLDIEASENESILAIQKLSLLALSVALQILQLILGRKQPRTPASLAFDIDQKRCLKQISSTVNGATPKQQNPHPTASLAWAVWIIARLGGWSGYQSQRPPGIVTFRRGLHVFQGMFAGWQLAQL